jgi:hypothetical protein
MLRVTLISALAITLTVATPIATTTGDSPPGNFTIQDAHCNAFSSGGNIGNCQWCANYLTNLGSTACGVDRNNGYPPEFCGHGNVLEKCQVYGTLPAGIDSTSSSWYVYRIPKWFKVKNRRDGLYH